MIRQQLSRHEPYLYDKDNPKNRVYLKDVRYIPYSGNWGVRELTAKLHWDDRVKLNSMLTPVLWYPGKHARPCIHYALRTSPRPWWLKAKYVTIEFKIGRFNESIHV